MAVSVKTDKPLKPRVVVKLDSDLLDAIFLHCALATNFPLSASARLTICGEGEQLIGQNRAERIAKGAVGLHPESPTTFFLKLNGAQINFIKNIQGEVALLTHHLEAYPDIEGRKLPGPAD